VSSSIIIIDTLHHSIVPQLESMGYNVDYQPDIDRELLIKIIHQYQGLILRSKTKIDGPLLKLAGKLQFVARAGAGVDNLDERLIRENGIRIINAPEGNRDSLAEHVMGMLLSLLHRISESDTAVRQGVWDREAARGSELGGKTVGLIGCGNMGCAFAKRLSSFDCKVLGYDKYQIKPKSSYYQPVSLERLFLESEIVSLHVPLTHETRGFYDYSFFQHFSKPIYLINSARGEILPLSDLVGLLKEQKVIAACLDVYQKEPFNQLADNHKDIYRFLVNSQRVLLTPHVAGWTTESYERINQVLVQKITHLKQAGLID
jgi:D-3-phosphoglycerate dehydrogenase